MRVNIPCKECKKDRWVTDNVPRDLCHKCAVRKRQKYPELDFLYDVFEWKYIRKGNQKQKKIYAEVECSVCNKKRFLARYEIFKRYKERGVLDTTCNRCIVKSFSGKNSPNFKGGWISYGGYKIIMVGVDDPYHEMGYLKNDRGTYELEEHRYIMAQHLGRNLTKDEDVHHINEIKTDNRIENLQLLSRSEHMALHSKKRRQAKLDLTP